LSCQRSSECETAARAISIAARMVNALDTNCATLRIDLVSNVPAGARDAILRSEANMSCSNGCALEQARLAGLHGSEIRRRERLAHQYLTGLSASSEIA
jgi:hypothetical protein